LPYYEITWHRNDVDVTRLTENGNVGDKAIIIEVSGIDSSLISYSKLGMPLGSDFCKQSTIKSFHENNQTVCARNFSWRNLRSGNCRNMPYVADCPPN